MTHGVDVATLARQVDGLLREASTRLIMPRFRQLAEPDIVEKTPGELVTIADRQTEIFLTEQLRSLIPGCRVVGEEACAADRSLLDDMTDGLVWIVDPLDGTAHFAGGNGPFGTIVALADNGQVVAGWTYDPLADRLCFAERGGGAHVAEAGRPLSPIRTEVPNPPIIASLATQFMPPDLRDAVIAAASQSYALKPIPRCAVEHYWRLGSGQDQIAMFQRTLPWDHAAGALFFQEAGGIVRRWNGSDYHFHDDRLGILAAATPELWEEAARLMLGDRLHGLPLIHH